MQKFKKSCFGTKLIISIDDKDPAETHIKKIFPMIDRFELKYSRFIDGNFLSKLNETKEALAPRELLSMIKLALKLSKISDGYFDITILPLLENIGYGIKKEKQEENIGYENIKIDGKKIHLENGVNIELGSLGKGYMLDTIYNSLEPHFQQFSINFGGDIRIKGEQLIYIEDPLDDSKVIGEVQLSNASIASSNPEKRRTPRGHHLIQAFKDREIDHKKAVFTTHKLGSFSDAFATALFVSPLKMSIDILENTSGLEGMIIAENGDIYKSKGFKVKLYS